MNLKEAYSILEIPQGTPPEDAKKKYRELTKKYHPDINKDAGAEDKFKKINEAYQVVSSGKSNDRAEQPQWQQNQNPYNPFGRQAKQVSHIEARTTVSFKDSVLGCKKELKFNRKTKCKDCNGEGEIAKNNGCEKCGGKGQVVTRQGFSVMIETCSKCYGRTQADACNTCNSEGTLEAEVTITVSIPGGIQNGNILRLGGMGNFAGHFGPIEQHSDVYLHLNVTPEKDLELQGNDVVTKLSISLLEALKGCHKPVKTILGTRDIQIKSKSKNKEEVIISHLGVNRQGNQRVILDIEYPENVDNLINILSEEGKA